MNRNELKSLINDHSKVESSNMVNRLYFKDWRNDNILINKGMLFDWINQLDSQIDEESMWKFIGEKYNGLIEANKAFLEHNGYRVIKKED